MTEFLLAHEHITGILTIAIASFFALSGSIACLTVHSTRTWRWKSGIAMCLLLGLAFVHLGTIQLEITRRAQVRVAQQEISLDSYQLLLARVSHSTTLHDEVQRIMADGTITREEYHDLETKLDEELLAQTKARLRQQTTHPLPRP